jgi:hypothetical protein
MSSDAPAGIHIVSTRLPAALGGALVGGGAIVHVARRPHADATAGMLEAGAYTRPLFGST